MATLSFNAFIFSVCMQRLHHVVKRDAVVKLQKISQHYQEKCQHWTNRSGMIPPIMVPPVTILPQQKRQPKVQDVQKTNNIEKVLETMASKKNSIVILNLLNLFSDFLKSVYLT